MAVIFSANGHEYSYPTSLNDITFERFLVYLDNILPREPEELTRIKDLSTEIADLEFKIENLSGGDINAIDKKNRVQHESQLQVAKLERSSLLDSINDVIYSHKFMPYFARVVSFFTGMPYRMIMGIGEFQGKPPMDHDQMEALYWMITSALEVKDYHYEYQNRFVFEDEVYFLPEKFMENSTVIEFMESAQFQAQMEEVKNGNWLAMLDVVCVLLKRKGEKYSSAVYTRNKQNFPRLPLNVLVDVAFFLQRRSRELGANFQIYTLSRNLARLKQESKHLQKITVGT